MSTRRKMLGCDSFFMMRISRKAVMGNCPPVKLGWLYQADTYALFFIVH